MDSTPRHVEPTTTETAAKTNPKPHFLIPMPDSPYYLWQAEVQATAMHDMGYDATWLVYTLEDYNYKPTHQLESFRRRPGCDVYVTQDWRPLAERTYHASMKPGMVAHYLRHHFPTPWQYMVIDPDVIPTGAVDYPLAGNGIVWGTGTDSYTGEKYLRSKGAWEPLCSLIGVTPDPSAPMLGTGAQMAAEGIDGATWWDIHHMSNTAHTILEAQGKHWNYTGEHPVQAWCAEMYVTQLLLIREGQRVLPHPAMSMVWADGPATGWDTDGFYHCAGVTAPEPGKFCKLNYQTMPPWQAALPELPASSASLRYVEYIRQTGACR